MKKITVVLMMLLAASTVYGKATIRGGVAVTGWTYGTVVDEAGDRMWCDFEESDDLTDKWNSSAVSDGNSVALDTSVKYAGAQSLKCTVTSANGGNDDNAHVRMYNLGDVVALEGGGQKAIQDDFWITFRYRWDSTVDWVASTSYYKNLIFYVRPYSYNAHSLLNSQYIGFALNPDGSLSVVANNAKTDTTYDIAESTWVRIQVHIQAPNAGTDQSTITVFVDGDQKYTASFTGPHSNYEQVFCGAITMNTTASNNFSFNYDNVSLSTFQTGTVIPYQASPGYGTIYNGGAICNYTPKVAVSSDDVPMTQKQGIGGLCRDSFYFDNTEDSEVLYLVRADGKDPDNDTVIFGVEPDGISIYGDYVTVENIAFKDFGRYGAYINNAADHITFDNDTFQNIQQRAVYIDDAGAGAYHDAYFTLKNSTISYISWGDLMAVSAGVYGEYTNYLTINNNAFDHIGEHAIRIDNNETGSLVANNTFDNIGSSSSCVQHCSDCIVENNTVSNASLFDIKCGITGVGIVRNNIVHDTWGHGGIGMWGSEPTGIVYNNVLYDNHGFDLVDVNARTNVIAYNNTFGSLVGPGENGGVGYSVGIYTDGSTGWTIKNNIGRYLRYTTNAPTVDYNLWYKASGDVIDANGTLYGNTNAFSVWQAIAGHTNELSADPKFRRASDGNFRLRGDSPAVNAGYDLSDYHDCIGTCDIGYNEYEPVHFMYR